MNVKPENYFHYWGKAAPLANDTNQRSFHLLAYHCLDVAAVGQQLLMQDPNLLRKVIPFEVFSDEPDREQWYVGVITFLLALHDVGKFSDRFQNLIPELLKELKGYSYTSPYTVHHTDMGRLLFEKEIWQKIWDQDWFHLDRNDDRSDWKDVWNPWFFAVTGHHGKPPEKPEPPISKLFEDENRQSAIQFSEACAMLFLTTKFSSHQIYSLSLIHI